MMYDIHSSHRIRFVIYDVSRFKKNKNRVKSNIGIGLILGNQVSRVRGFTGLPLVFT